jgi:hypothetical protein
MSDEPKIIDIRMPDGSIRKLDLTTGRGDWEQDFANHPKSIGELRADKTQHAKDWTPRDALIEMLRSIDSGEMVLDALVVVGRQIMPDGAIHTARRVSAPDTIVAVGLLNRAAFEIQHTNAHDD